MASKQQASTIRSILFAIYASIAIGAVLAIGLSLTLSSTTGIFATDAGVYPHGDNGKQFARAVRFGMTPAQAIISATSLSAELLGWEDKVGRIAPGMYADIIAVHSDPLSDISELEDVDFVIEGWRRLQERVTD